MTTTEDLLRERDRLPAGDAGRAVLRARAIEQNLPMASRLAVRYQGRGVPLDDLNQVAAVALITAVDRFDSSRPSLFVSYAIPTILGTLKRYFRDAGWGLRVPRATQELAGAVRVAIGELNQTLGRTPSTTDIAAHLHADAGDVVAAIGAVHAYRPATLSAPGCEAESRSLDDTVGRVDRRYAVVDDRLTLRPLIAGLPARERRILELYYYAGMSQSRIAAEAGISQMHVSRLLRHALGILRTGLKRDTPVQEQPMPNLVTERSA